MNKEGIKECVNELLNAFQLHGIEVVPNGNYINENSISKIT